MILSCENDIATKACKVLGEDIAYCKEAIWNYVLLQFLKNDKFFLKIFWG
jgi:hypothetical protein